MRTPRTLLFLGLALAGCGHAHDGQEGPDGDAGAVAGHAHAAPHGGTLLELGDEFAHLEVLLDAASGTVDVWVLDGSADRGVRLPGGSLVLALTDAPAFELTLTGVASALTGETEDDTSAFRGRDERLVGRPRFEGAFPRLTVRGQLFEAVSFRYPEGNGDGADDHGHGG